MKPLLKTIALLVAVAVAAGLISYRLASEAQLREALAKRDALTWLRTDFRLSAEQFAAVRQLHESYSKECEQHCRAIQEAVTACDALKSAGKPDPRALAAAEKRIEELRSVCESAIAGHVRQVAAQMEPREGQRYLALVLPKIADFDHRAPPDVGLNNTHRH